MDKKEFKDFLMLYGADLNVWPGELKDEANVILSAGSEAAGELTALVEEEVRFEALLGERSFVEPDDYLAGRIIAFARESAVQERAAAEDDRGLLGWLFAEFFTPRAAIALALTLIIGFMAGYMTPGATLDPFDQLLEDEMMLEETFSTLFMEGDIFE